MMSVTDWETYIATQEAEAKKAREQLQHLITASGIPISQLQEMAGVDLSAIDPELIQEIELSTGIKIQDLKTEKPKHTATSYRLKGKSIAV